MSHAFITEGNLQRILCAHEGCDTVPHMVGVTFGRGAVPTSKSGPGLMIECLCENGHHWVIVFEDHSGGTWISCQRLPDLSEEETYARLVGRRDK